MARERVVKVVSESPMGWVLFMAWIGAAVYFYQLHPGFWGFFLALLQAAVWPAYVVFEVLKALHIG